jgi:hypothetical protein
MLGKQPQDLFSSFESIFLGLSFRVECKEFQGGVGCAGGRTGEAAGHA